MNETLPILLFRLEAVRDYRDILRNSTYFSVETRKKMHQKASKIGCCVLITRGEYSTIISHETSILLLLRLENTLKFFLTIFSKLIYFIET